MLVLLGQEANLIMTNTQKLLQCSTIAPPPDMPGVHTPALDKLATWKLYPSRGYQGTTLIPSD
jgi:hypothetical protein